MMKCKVTYRGWAGHFICAHDCRFRLNTLIEHGERRIVVSTVGHFVGSDGKVLPLGARNRMYETMAFEAKENGVYWDADVSKDVEFDSVWSIHHIKRDTDAEAQEMHEKVVKELVDKLEKGDE